MRALAVMPVFMREPPDLELTVKAAESVRASDPSVDLLLVDDCSPAAGLVDELEGHIAGLQFELWRNEENEGFSRTVNRGLARARDEERDAVLLNADIEILTPDWSRILREHSGLETAAPAVLGAMLLYPPGELIQHAGVFFSFLVREFDHRFRFAPASLPEANRPWRCPVTGAFQYIRHEALATVGLYDEGFRMAFEDVDYCLRVFDAGMESVYVPTVRALHHESVFRGRADRKLTDWQIASKRRLERKHAKRGMAEWVPEIV